MIIGLAALLVQRPPDILIDDRGKLFAVKSADGSFLLSSKRVSKFVGQTWLRRVGHNPAAKSNFPKTGYGKDGRLACDQLGCILKLNGQTIGLIMQNQALPEDCRLADVIISAVPVFWGCPSAKLIIDRFDLYRNGAHAVWIDDAGVTVKSVNQERGYRPWVLRPKRRGAE